MRVRIKKAYAEYLLGLSPTESDELKASIRADGVHVPIDVDEDGYVLDGNHRQKFSQSILKKDAPFRVISGLAEDEKEAYIYRANLSRRHITPEQRELITARRKALAKKWSNQFGGDKTQEEIGRLLGVSQGVISRWLKEFSSMRAHKTKPSGKPGPKPKKKKKRARKLKLTVEDELDIHRQLQSGVTARDVASEYGVTAGRVSQIKKKKQKEAEKLAKRREAVERGAKLIAGTGSPVQAGKFQELMPYLPDASVELIFTDPPYDDESVPLYHELFALAASKLMDGGSLLCYAGHKNLGQILSGIVEPLQHFWTVAVLHGGNTKRLPGKNLFVGWKPILWLTNGSMRIEKAQGKFVADVVKSKPNKPGMHGKGWEQSTEEATYYIEHLTHKNGVVLDPMCGAGTTGVAAKKLGRTFVGYDQDVNVAAVAADAVQSA